MILNFLTQAVGIIRSMGTSLVGYHLAGDWVRELAEASERRRKEGGRLGVSGIEEVKERREFQVVNDME